MQRWVYYVVKVAYMTECRAEQSVSIAKGRSSAEQWEVQKVAGVSFLLSFVIQLLPLLWAEWMCIRIAKIFPPFIFIFFIGAYCLFKWLVGFWWFSSISLNSSFLFLNLTRRRRPARTNMARVFRKCKSATFQIGSDTYTIGKSPRLGCCVHVIVPLIDHLLRLLFYFVVEILKWT